MTPRRRLALSLVISAIGTVAILTTLAFRLHHWSKVGWVGLNYFADVTSKSPRAAKRSFLLTPGRVVVVWPGSPAGRAGMNSDEVVESINGIPISDMKRIVALDRSVRTGSALTYRLRRNDQQRVVNVRLTSPFDSARMIASLVLSLLLATVFIAIGVAVFWRRPDDRRAFIFFVMSMVGAASFLGSMAIAVDASNMRGISTTPNAALMVIAVYVTATFAFAALTLHLSLVFPHDRAVLSRKPWIIRWIYVVPVFAALMVGTALASPSFVTNLEGAKTFNYVVGPGFRFFVAALGLAGALIALRIAYKSRTEGVRTAFLSRPIQTVFSFDAVIAAIALLLEVAGARAASRLVFLFGITIPCMAIVAYPVLAFIALYRSYREANVEEKRQVKWPLWGTMTALATKIVFGLSGLLISILISLRVVQTTTWMSFVQTIDMIPRLAYLLIPITFAIAIMKYRLMNIDVIIKKTVAYGILTGLIIAMYLILVGGLGTMLVTVAGVKNQTMVIASTLVVALVFVPLRNRLQHLVDRNLFRQKYDYPQALRAIAAETLVATDLRAFLAFGAETLQQALQNRSVVIFERRQDDLITSAKVGLPDTILGSVRMDAMQAEAIDRPLNPARRQLPERAASALRRVGAALAVPIRSQGFLHGLLALGSKLSDREFDLEDLDFVSSVADQIAITIDRIRLQRDEEDFEQAREMQQALLPASTPQIKGIDISGTWKPARDVSGDYYDLLALGADQLGVCIGDVAGKGMPAALLMSALQAAVRASATAEMSAADLCERVRRVIVPSLAGGRFVTFFYCTIDMAAKRIRYCNAGQNPPVLVRAGGTTIRLDKGGPALSRLFSRTPYQAGEEELRDGDRIVLFTDGVSEARDSRGDDYGEERLEQIIAANRHMSAPDLIATIVDSVLAFSAGRADDDLTMVALAITQPA